MPVPTLMPKTDPKTRHQPRYAVVVLNDDVHTFEYVLSGLMKIFKYALVEGTRLTLKIHYEGRAAVWIGSLEAAELKKEQLESLGPDQNARVRNLGPIGVVLEPLD